MSRPRMPFRFTTVRAVPTGFLILIALARCSDSSAGPQNAAPVAVVRPVTAAVRGDTVVLDGTASSDAEGDSLRFTWTMLSRPAGSSAELIPIDAPSPAFVADRVGSYQVSLVVSDGHKSSSPDQTTVTVTIPAPRVIIDSPADEAIVTSSPTTVTGSVTDASAVTVNGVAATVNASSGTFTASVPLTAGSNTIIAAATNATGVGSAEIAVILNTANAPVVVIAAPKKDFLVGDTYLGSETPNSEAVPVRGTIRVYTTETVNTPTVMVQGVAAVIGDTSFSGCPTAPPKRCFKFSVTLSLARGNHTLQAVGRDVLNGQGSASVKGVSDYAYHPSDTQWENENKTVNPVDWTSFPNMASIKQPGGSITQNVRAQEIDGCSAPTGEDHRNNPMEGATENRDGTAFGSGSQPPDEYLIFGQSSSDALPCNKHDVCYQTVGSLRATCDGNFLDDMRAVCKKAYPTETTAYLLAHPKYKNEQSKCFNKAQLYYSAVTVAGASKFNKRQAQHTYTP